jgi:competence protein ComEC
VKNFSLVFLSVAFVIGVFLESFLKFGYAFFFLSLFLSFVFFIFYHFKFKGDFDNEIYLKVSVFLIAFSVGILRMTFSFPTSLPLETFLNQKVTLEGIVYEEPDKRENFVFLKLKNEKILSQEQKEIQSKILVKANLFPDFLYGDRIEVSGYLERPEKFETDNGEFFDYPSYLAKDGIYYILEKTTIKKLASDEGNSVKAFLFKIKNSFVNSMNKNIREPESSLLSGLLLGNKQSLGKEVMEDFKRAGVMHIVVLSGYNITIIADSVMKFFGKFLPYYFNFSLGALAIILFAIMTGASATVVRASIMALVVIIARFTGRTYMAGRALIIAGLLMVIHNPAIVAFDPSFQLSFMATLGLIYIPPIIEHKFLWITEKWKLREIMISTISTQILVLPLIIHMTGQFSVIGIVANLLILVFIPATMFFGFFAGVVGFVSSVLALPLSFIAYALLFYEIKTAEILSSLPFASISMPVLSGYLTLIIYIALAFYIKYQYKKINKIVK